MSEWDEEQHPRDKDGRFSSGGGGGLDKWAAHRAQKFAGPLISKIEKNGGFTYKPDAAKAERTPKDGYMVSSDTKDKLGHVVEIAKMAEREPPPTEAEVRSEIRSQVQKWLTGAVKKIAGQKGAYLGGYIETDEKTGRTVALHLDISHHFSANDRERAIKEGIARNQISIWDVAKGEEIKTGGTGR